MVAAARARGLPAVAAWSASFLSGAYPSLEASTQALGGDLSALLGLWLGDRSIPE
jgi:hypothetical protein